MKYIVWNAFEDMPAWPGTYTSLVTALEAAIAKKEMYAEQGYYAYGVGSGTLRVPYASLKVGVAWSDLSFEEKDALTFVVVNANSKNGGLIARPAKKETAQ